MTRLLFILPLVFGISFGPAPAWAGEPFMAPDGTAYPDDVQAVLTEARAAYDAEDFQRAHALWLPLAETGNAEAQYRVGRLYSFGEGVSRDGPKAVQWYTSASDQGHRSATFNLALLYGRGKLVPANINRAFRLSCLSLKLDDQESLILYGLLAMSERNSARNVVSGLKWLFLAEGMGNARASNLLSMFSKSELRRHLKPAELRAASIMNGTRELMAPDC